MDHEHINSWHVTHRLHSYTPLCQFIICPHVTPVVSGLDLWYPAMMPRVDNMTVARSTKLHLVNLFAWTYFRLQRPSSYHFDKFHRQEDHQQPREVAYGERERERGNGGKSGQGVRHRRFWLHRLLADQEASPQGIYRPHNPQKLGCIHLLLL